VERRIGTTDLRQRLTDVLEAVCEDRTAYVVETFGRPQAAIINLDDYEQFQRLQEERAVLRVAGDHGHAARRAERGPQRPADTGDHRESPRRGRPGRRVDRAPRGHRHQFPRQLCVDEGRDHAPDHRALAGQFLPAALDVGHPGRACRGSAAIADPAAGRRPVG